jgi:dephospho-CoA kinase
MMKVIGLTGGIGSGKSTVAKFLAEMGAVVLDVDKVGHEALKPNSKAWKKVVNEFGKDILNAGGEIDRARLGEIVFNNPEALQRLNKIMHPAIDDIVKARLEEYRRQGVDEVVLEAAVILEAERTSQVHELWVTVAPEATVIRRIMERTGLSEQEARARVQSQLSNEERIKHADVVIDTDCSLDELKNRVLRVWMRNKTRFASFDSP